VGGEDMNAKLPFIAAHATEHAVRLMPSNLRGTVR